MITLLAGCGGRPPADGALRPSEEKVLSVYTRPAYVAERAAADFRKRTGIQVAFDPYDSQPVHEIKLLVGKSGHDVVVTSATFLGQLAGSGVFLELDRERLPNFAHLDPQVLERIALHDPGNRHAVPFLWGMTGIAYNPPRVLAALGTDHVDSWAAVFRPDLAGRLVGCGIGVADSAQDVIAAALLFLGFDPNAEDAEQLAAAEAMLMQARPLLRVLDRAQLVAQLAGGELCVALARNGDVREARARGAQALPAVEVAFSLPAEGASAWYDVVAIPAEAPHASNAHAFIDYLMDPQVMAGITNDVGYANGNAASFAAVEARWRDDPAVYPHPQAVGRLRPQLAHSPSYHRLVDASWGRFLGGTQE